MSDDFDDDFEPQPLERHEAALVRRDIDDLVAFRRTFEPEGYKGVSMFCADCVEEHYYGWDMLEGNLRSLLESGDYPVHEPPYDPRPEDYVNWEYAQGYIDGLVDTSPPPLPLRAPGACPFCGIELNGVPEASVYCPGCGTMLGIARLADALRERGMGTEELRELLQGARLPLPSWESRGRPE